MYTVGKLAKRFGLSRSTLLYYDSIGLLSPSDKSEANYRIYSDHDAERLEQICAYRAAGIRLKDIGRILDGAGKQKYVSILAGRLHELNEDVAGLREQQRLIVEILKRDALRKRLGNMDKDAWVALMEAAGLNEEEMQTWHKQFEKQSPSSHQAFLESLGVSKKEIAFIRRWAKGE